MISVQNNGMSPTNPPKQDNKTNLPLVIGSTLGFGAFGALGGYSMSRVKHQKGEDGVEKLSSGSHLYWREGNTQDYNLVTKPNKLFKTKELQKASFSKTSVDDYFSKQDSNIDQSIYRFKEGKLDRFQKGRKNILTMEDFDASGNLKQGTHYTPDYEAMAWQSETTLGSYNSATSKKGSKKALGDVVELTGKGVIPPVVQKSEWDNNPTMKKQFELLNPQNYHHEKLGDFIEFEGFADTSKERLKDLPKDLPTKFDELLPYLEAKRNKYVALGAIGFGVLAGGSAFLISRLTAKKPEAIPPQTTS
jgi:hypothetical protein